MEFEMERPQKDDSKKDFSLIIKIVAAFITILIGMQKNYFAYYKPRAVMIVIVIPILCMLKIEDVEFLPIIVGVMTIIFLETVDSYLWKYPPFSWMFTIENFSGTYEGSQVSSRLVRIGKVTNTNNIICKQFEKSLHLKLVIHQTGSKIIVYSFYSDAHGEKSSKSESDQIMVTVGKDKKHYTLAYNYGNIGVLKKGGHHGTTILKFIKDTNTLKIEGGYYTNRNPQTRGEFVDLIRKSMRTDHPF